MIHALLKQSTRVFHRAIEARLGVLVSDEISLEEYIAVQKLFYGFYKPVEDRLAAFIGQEDPELQLANRLRLPLLVQDLAFLDVPAAELEALPACDSIPPLQTVPEVLGCLYVLEGSTLGGRVIARHLEKVLHLSESQGCSFLNSHGDSRGPMWSGLLSVLARHCQEHRDQVAVVGSARLTFSCLETWLSSAGSGA